MANAFKFEKDDTSYNEIFKASEGFTQKSKNTNYTTRNVLKDFDSIYNKKYEDVLNADKARQKAEEEYNAFCLCPAVSDAAKSSTYVDQYEEKAEELEKVV